MLFPSRWPTQCSSDNTPAVAATPFSPRAGWSAASGVASLASSRRSVYKFGGSSVGSAEAFRSCGGVLTANHEAGNQTVAVLSAMYGVTNKLMDAAVSAGKGNIARVQKLRGELLDLHCGTAKGSWGAVGLAAVDGVVVVAAAATHATLTIAPPPRLTCAELINGKNRRDDCMSYIDFTFSVSALLPDPDLVPLRTPSSQRP